jgi:hypothetical protein
MESVTGKRQNTKVSRRARGRGKDQHENISGSPGRERRREREQNTLGSKEGIEGTHKGSKQLQAGKHMGKALGASVAKRADSIVSDRPLKPGSRGPGKIKRADAQRGEVWRPTIGENMNVVCDLLEGNVGIKVFQSPSGKSAMHKGLERSGVQDAVKDVKHELLWFGRFGAQSTHQRFI